MGIGQSETHHAEPGIVEDSLCQGRWQADDIRDVTVPGAVPSVVGDVVRVAGDVEVVCEPSVRDAAMTATTAAAELGQRPIGAALDGAEWHAEHSRHLLLAQVREVAQHQHLLLRSRQRGECCLQAVPRGDGVLGSLVGRRLVAARLGRRMLAPPAAATLSHER